MRTLLVLLLLVVAPALAQEPTDSFPPDPAGVRVVDRDAIFFNDQYFYAIAYNQAGRGHLEVYQGLPWKKVYEWSIEFQGEPITLAPVTVLHIDEFESTLVFYWDDFVGYREGAVHQSVVYDPKKGRFETQWSD